jgi:hypothetical protein
MQNPLALDADYIPKRDVGGVDAAGTDRPEQGVVLGQVEAGIAIG